MIIQLYLKCTIVATLPHLIASSCTKQKQNILQQHCAYSQTEKHTIIVQIQNRRMKMCTIHTNLCAFRHMPSPSCKSVLCWRAAFCYSLGKTHFKILEVFKIHLASRSVEHFLYSVDMEGGGWLSSANLCHRQKQQPTG